MQSTDSYLTDAAFGIAAGITFLVILAGMAQVLP